MEIIKKRVGQGDTCLKKIVRCKNLFTENQRKYGQKGLFARFNREWLYRYADIKFNILVESKDLRVSMICEGTFVYNTIYLLFYSIFIMIARHYLII